MDTSFRITANKNEIKVTELKETIPEQKEAVKAPVKQEPSIEEMRRQAHDPYRIAQDVVNRGIERQASYGEYVKAMSLKPEMDAKEWYKIYDQVKRTTTTPTEVAKPTEQPLRAEINESMQAVGAKPLEVEAKRYMPAGESAEIDERYVLTNPRVKEDGYGTGSEFETKEPSGETVTIYRAVTKDIQNIHPLEYVTLSEKICSIPFR